MTYLGLMHADAVHFHLPCCVKQVEISFSRHLSTAAHHRVSLYSIAVMDKFRFILIGFTEYLAINENNT